MSEAQGILVVVLGGYVTMGLLVLSLLQLSRRGRTRRP